MDSSTESSADSSPESQQRKRTLSWTPSPRSAKRHQQECPSPQPPPSLGQSSSSLMHFFNPETNYPAFDSLRTHLGIRGLFKLTATCKELYALRQYMWDINRSLSRFVEDPRAFRSQLGEVQGLISGSFALQFFEGVVWKNSDLDIFVQGTNQEKLAQYLVASERYSLTKEQPEFQTGYVDCNHINRVDTYLRSKDGGSGHQAKIQIISTSTAPLFAILNGFYCTALLNVITWNKAYSFFPLPTFVRHKAYMCVDINDYFGGLMRKISRRGWKTQGVQWPEEITTMTPFRRARRTGDCYTWKISFDISGIQKPIVPDFVIEYSEFRITHGDPRGHSRDHYHIEASDFQASTLRYDYSYGDPGWCIYLGARMEHLTFLELMKMDPETRPLEIKDVGPTTLHILAGKFTRPDYWTYYDEEIPAWHDQYLLESSARGSKEWGAIPPR